MIGTDFIIKYLKAESAVELAFFSMCISVLMILQYFQFGRSRIGYCLSTILLLGVTTMVYAEPWIDTSNLALRNEIQYLADKGLIKAPVTTYPLMWAAIAPDLHAIDAAQLDTPSRNAYINVMGHLSFAKQNIGSVRLNVSNDDLRFTSFGDNYRDKNSLTVSYSALGERWAVKLSPSYTLDPDDDDNFRLDESYIAGYLGNWVLTAGFQDRWWAPGWDTNLSLTSNARPMPGISLSRKNSAPFRLIFTDDYQIPWNLTTFMSHMGDERTIPNALLWGFRFNFKPFRRLELGITRLAQWAGDGRPSGLSTFWDILLGRDNCGINIDCSNDQEPGNQQAGIDARLALTILGHNVGLYGQFHAEDGSDSSIKFWTKKRPQFGIDSTVMLVDTPVLMFLEYTDTLEFCGDGESRGIGDCYYEHGLYRTGLRYKGRVIGNIYENDATSIVFGMVSQMVNDVSWQWKLRYVELNQDNSDRFPGEPNGNTLTEISEDVIMLSGKYQRIFGRWKLALGGNASRSEFRDKNQENDFTVFLDIEYLL